MGSPRQTFAGETRLRRQLAEPVAKGSRGTECLPLKDISLPSGTASPLPLCPRWTRRRRRTPRSWESLPPRNIYFDPAPPQPQCLPLGRRPVGDCLSRSTLQETETFKEGDEDMKPSFPF